MGRRAPTQDVLAELAASLGPGQLLGPADGLERYERAPFDGTRGAAAFVARPRTTAEVRAVLRWAHRHEVGLVAQGANTGLVHAGFPDGSGTTGVLSLELCRERFELDAVNRTLTVSAGWTLDALNERLAPEGLVLPIDLGSDPAVGGMVSTNTGGTRMIGYGDVRHRVLGLEVVLPDEGATVLEDLSGLRKDNTGVDLKQLFVGTGGQFGVVTAATFELAP
ncbi:MAG: FAD-binding oxidoreductase, partial [Acidimicrobiia bacterium]